MEADVAVVVAVVVALSAMAQTVTGFGFSLLAVPPMSLVLEPADAVAVGLVLLVSANVLIVLVERAELDRVATSWLLAGSAIGLPIGLVAIRAASADGLRLALAVAVLAAVVVVVSGRPRIGGGPITLVTAGVLTGALTTSLTTSGPPTALVLQGRQLPPSSFRPTIGVVLGVSAAIGVAMFAVEGRLNGQVLAAVAVGFPAQIAGWAVGLRLRNRVPVAWFRRAIIGLLVLGAVVSAAAALR